MPSTDQKENQEKNARNNKMPIEHLSLPQTSRANPEVHSTHDRSADFNSHQFFSHGMVAVWRLDICVCACVCVCTLQCIDSNNCLVDSFVRVDRRGGVGVAT